jgi:limonene-1,2-epoxide hydrolase
MRPRRAATTISTASPTRRSSYSRISGTSTARAGSPKRSGPQQERYSSRKYEIKFLSVDGAKVATILHLSLRKRNDDRVVQLEVADFFTLRVGRILEHRSFFDSFDFVQQLLGQDLTDAFAASVRNAMRP